jgi:membrane protease YdiL (CAAX protease family)
MANIKKIISRISIGLILILFWVFMYVKAPQLYANGEALQKTMLVYMIITALFLGWDTLSSRKVEEPLFRESVFRAIPIFLIFFVIGFALLFIFGLFVNSSAQTDIYKAVSGIGSGLIILHLLFVSTMETLIFQRRVPVELQSRGISKNMAWFISALIFAFFHFTLSATYYQLLIYIPLHYLFMWVGTKYAPRTFVSAMGIHSAWNFWILGFFS